VYPCIATTSATTGFGIQELRQLVAQSASLDLWSAWDEDERQQATADDLDPNKVGQYDLPPVMLLSEAEKQKLKKGKK